MSARASEAGAGTSAGERSGGSQVGLSVRRRIRSMFVSGRLPALLFALALAIVLYGLLYSSDYDVRTVRVDGASIGDAETIAGRSAVMDESIFRVDPQQAADRIAALPYVESVHVTLEFPAQVHIDVVERVPVVIWQVAGETYLVDSHGNVLAEAADDPELPVIMSNGDTVEPGDQVNAEPVRFAEAVNASRAGEEVTRFSWSSSTGLIAQLTENRRALLGTPEKAAAKVVVLEELISSIDDEWQTLDVTVPERPVYR